MQANMIKFDQHRRPCAAFLANTVRGTKPGNQGPKISDLRALKRTNCTIYHWKAENPLIMNLRVPFLRARRVPDYRGG